MQLSMGKFSRPGPGFLPFGLSIILIALSMALILKQWGKGIPSPFWPGRRWVRPFLGVVAFGLYAFLIEYLGFLATTCVFLLLWLGVIEKSSWVRMVLISVSVTAILYLIFGIFLEVPLPTGYFG